LFTISRTVTNIIHRPYWSYYNVMPRFYENYRRLILVALGPHCSVRSITLWTLSKFFITSVLTLPVVLYGYETWTLTLREKHRLGVFENRVLGRIFGGKRDEATGEWRKLHDEELRDLYSSPSINRIMKARMRWAGHVARMRRGTCIGCWWDSQREEGH
jgi:hypothetical protein